MIKGMVTVAMGLLAAATSSLAHADSLIATRKSVHVPHSQPMAEVLVRASVQAPRRSALVIGNSAYAEGRLANAVNDAESVSRTLQKMGFAVTLVLNADKRTIDEALEAFSRRLGPGEIGLIYFSGHGVQVEGENYLVPINAQLSRQTDAQYDAVPLGKVINAVEATHAAARIIILDACRNNPFYRRWRSTSRGVFARGLAAPFESGNSGTLIAFSTAPGKAALDGLGNSPNSPFTAHLLRHLPTPNLEVGQLFRRVRSAVAQETNNEQIPWVSEALLQEVYLNPMNTASGTTVDLPIRKQDLPNSSSPNPSKRPSPLEDLKPQPSTVFAPPQSSLVSSSTGLDYSMLQKLLSKGDYKEADELTLKLLILAARSRNKDWTNRDWLENQDIWNLDCNDLVIIDNLWSRYSSGKQGILVQLGIWNETVARSPSISEAYIDFARKIQWIPPSNYASESNYISIHFINYKTPPAGHLPIQLTYPISEGWSNGGLYTNRHLLYTRYSSCRNSRI
jgi:hypothetical protein